MQCVPTEGQRSIVIVEHVYTSEGRCSDPYCLLPDPVHHHILATSEIAPHRVESSPRKGSSSVWDQNRKSGKWRKRWLVCAMWPEEGPQRTSLEGGQAWMIACQGWVTAHMGVHWSFRDPRPFDPHKSDTHCRAFPGSSKVTVTQISQIQILLLFQKQMYQSQKKKKKRKMMFWWSTYNFRPTPWIKWKPLTPYPPRCANKYNKI